MPPRDPSRAAHGAVLKCGCPAAEGVRPRPEADGTVQPAVEGAHGPIDRYELALAAGGVFLLITAWLLPAGRRRSVSLPSIVVGFAALASWLPLGLPEVRIDEERDVVERLTEATVVVSLMGAGLRLDRPVGWRRWASTWRLLGLAMPLTIAAVALLGVVVVGLPLASALLLGAALAPTDPVLASDVQVGEPTLGPDPEAGPEEDEVRFALTSEAGLNDGLAFPFVYGAIALAASGGGAGWIPGWVAVDVVVRLGVGVAVGVLAGKLLAAVLFRPPLRLPPLAESATGFVVVGATFFAYGIAAAGPWLRVRGRLRGRHRAAVVRSRSRVPRGAAHVRRGGRTAAEPRCPGALRWPARVRGARCAQLAGGGAGRADGGGGPPAHRMVLARREQARRGRTNGGGRVRHPWRGFALLPDVRARARTTRPRRRAVGTVSCTIVLSLLVHGFAATAVMRHLDRRAGRKVT